MKTNERILQELRELRREVGVLRGELANRRCRGGTPAPAHPPPPSPWIPVRHPWASWPYTWCHNSSGDAPENVTSGYMKFEAPKL